MEQALVEYLLNALWQLPLFAGSAWLLLWLLRPAPQTQHRVWIAVLALAVILPLHRTRATTPPPTMHLTVAVAPNTSPATRWAEGLRLGPGTTRWLVRLYLVSVGIALLRIAWAWRTAQQLVDNSRPADLSSPAMAAFESYGQSLGVKLPQLRTSNAVSSPLVVGLRTASLLLPEDFASHTENEIRAALCHELAHVQRGDYLANLACEVAAVPLSWHPAMHEVLQRIRTTREMVCDAMAAQQMDSHLGYAKCLVTLAQSMVSQNGMLLGLFSKHTLEERVMQLTNNTTLKMRASAIRFATGLALMIATGAIATTFHVTPTLAQTTPASAPPSVIAPAPTPAPEPAPNPTGTAKTFHVRRERRTLTPAEKAELQKKLDMAHQRMAKATEMMNSPEFRERMEDAQRQMVKSTEMLNSPEFKQRMAEAQKQMARATEMLDSSEFKRRMAEAQEQMAKATAMLDNPDFKRKLEDAQKQIEDMDQAIRDAMPPPTDSDNN